LYWHPIRRHWILYLKARNGTTPLDDFLVKELSITGPDGQYREPGSWLIDYLRREDKTRGGSIDPDRANKQILGSQYLRDEERRQRVQADWRDTSHQWLKEADRLIGRSAYSGPGK
jgi:hypothetical protein